MQERPRPGLGEGEAGSEATRVRPTHFAISPGSSLCSTTLKPFICTCRSPLAFSILRAILFL